MILRLTPADIQADPYPDANQDSLIVAGRVHARRRWITRTALALLASAVALCLVVVVNRDRDTVNGTLRSSAPFITALQGQIDALGQLPVELPVVATRLSLAYVDDLTREYAKTAREPVIIATSRGAPLVLGSNGNLVILYEQGKVRQEWWNRLDFVNAWQVQETRIKAWEAARRAANPCLP